MILGGGDGSSNNNHGENDAENILL